MHLVRSVEVLFAPAEFAALKQRDLGKSFCIVFDVLRATSSMVAALANGATAIIPVEEIEEALARRQINPDVLLAGERGGLRIRADLTGGVEFDLGNSPREFIRQRVQGKTIVATTTNGTRALRACAGAQKILIGSFLNLTAVALWIERHPPAELLLVCSGTVNQAAYEDILAAGALCEWIGQRGEIPFIADSAHIARQLYRLGATNLIGAMQFSRNARRLMAHPELSDDVAYCLRRDQFPILAELQNDGCVRQISP